MAKNPFKKSSITDTIVNVGIGGAANVAVDYLVDQIQENSENSIGDTTINAIKIAAGAILGSMVSNKYARAACDGIATVGVSNMVAGIMADSGVDAGSDNATSGLPYGTIGRVVPGNRAYMKKVKRVSGAGAAAVMGK